MFNARISRLSLAAAFASLAIAAPAQADSVVYVKDGDVYLTTTDVARQYQVTAGSEYNAASQADDGTILATTKLGRMRRLDRAGRTLSEVGSIAGGSTASFTFKGPYDADISPNGAKIAYGYIYSGYTNANGGTYVNEGNATAFARAEGSTEPGESGFKTSREYDHPEWVDDQRVLVSNGPGYPSDPFAVVEAGSGNSRSWFTDPANMHPHDATLSRNWRMLAATNANRDGLYVYRDDDALLLGGVHACFYYSPDGPGYKYSSPTFNAAGTKLFWANGKGLEFADVGNSGSSCPDGIGSKEAIPGASSPDWGPADVPAARPMSEVPGYVAPATPTPVPTPVATPAPTNGVVPGGKTPTTKDGSQVNQSGGSGQLTDQPGGGQRSDQPGTQNAGSLSLLTAKTKLRKALTSGLTVTVTAPAAGKVSLSATVAGKSVASGSTTAKRAGLVTVKLTFTAAAKRRYARAAKLALAIKATQGAATGTAGATLRK